MFFYLAAPSPSCHRLFSSTAGFDQILLFIFVLQILEIHATLLHGEL